MINQIGLIKYEIEMPEQDPEVRYKLITFKERPSHIDMMKKLNGMYPTCYIHSVEFIPILEF